MTSSQEDRRLLAELEQGMIRVTSVAPERFRARRLRAAAARHALWAERLLALAERAEAGDDFLARIRHAKTEHKRGLKS